VSVLLADYDFLLPPERIAQQPARRGEACRLLHLRRDAADVGHHRFGELPGLLRAGDVLVLNDTAVISGRLHGRKPSGGRVEVLVVDYAGGREDAGIAGGFVCRCLLRGARQLGPGARLAFDQGLEAEVLAFDDGLHTLRFSGPAPFAEMLERVGHVPLPPYIQRPQGAPADSDDRQTYQTVYARQQGAIAAPTAGLHFTPGLLARLRAAGVALAFLTLHVGHGTFLPIRSADIRDHRMHAERFHLSSESAACIDRARAAGGRVVAVGTTCVRTLEHQAAADGSLRPGAGWCDLYIYPGFRFRVVDAMITNFHLPRSTLLLLVSALAGRERVLAAYREAIAMNYRFYSYGDAMLIS
jgi:S-adenosylmethionine:tRNA ribosyltransferase-isomerase